MKITQHSNAVSLCSTVNTYKELLVNNELCVLSSINHIDHIAAYLAWCEVGGNIFIKSPLLPIEQSSFLDKKIKGYSLHNSIIFHTSGTTGIPKLVIHTRKQFDQMIRMSTGAMGWNTHTKFLNFIPAFTSGFWHIIIPCLVKYDCEITLGKRETIVDDLKLDHNLTLLVPAMVDHLRTKQASIDLSQFNKICLGASQVLSRHVEYVFSNRAQTVCHMYGSTEFGSPILKRDSSHPDDFSTYLDLTPMSDAAFSISSTNQLLIKGDSLCENIKEFDFDGEWFNTNDLWEIRQDNKIVFLGRSNDIVKVNGYQCSLLLIENIIEGFTDLGETLAVPRSSLGTDWVEIFYTNKNSRIKKHALKEMLKSKLPSCNIPRRITYVDAIPKNSLGKKIRNVL